jgi:hypothetical protein
VLHFVVGDMVCSSRDELQTLQSVRRWCCLCSVCLGRSSMLGMYYILYMCVCGPVRYDNCIGHFPRGSQGGGGRYAPPGYAQCLRQRPEIIFCVVFAIFNGFVN